MKIKAILTIVIAVLAGFLIGFFSSGLLHKHEMDKMHKHSYQEMFVHRTMGIIDPSPDQKDSLLPIVENYADKALELKKNVSQSFDSLMKEMNLALKPYLTDDQYNKLEQTAMRYRSRADRPQ